MPESLTALSGQLSGQPFWQLFWRPLWPAAAAAVLAVAIIVVMRTTGWGSGVLDEPNARSMHGAPVPRTGGIALIGALLAVALAQTALPRQAAADWPSAWLLLGLPTLALGLLGAVDDRRGLPVRVRLPLQLAAALPVAWTLAGGAVPAPAAGPMLAGATLLFMLAIGWSTNLYNFMDGIDGLAGTMTVVGFGTLAIACPAGSSLQVLAAAAAGAAAGFLLFNRPPARIFLGDAGSIPLGFLAAGIGLLGWHHGYWPIWFAPIVFLPFVCDASLTLALRLLRGERVWTAHREHAYQKLALLGLGHGATTAVYGALMLACAAVALTARTWSAGAGSAAIAAIIALHVLGYGWAASRWHRRQKRQHTISSGTVRR
ncbi:MAG: glycosyltransferase family 4 protein [Burkholderiaceae bacterium]